MKVNKFLIAFVVILIIIGAFYIGKTQNQNSSLNSNNPNSLEIQTKDDLANKGKCTSVGEALYKQDLENAARDNVLSTKMLDVHEYAYNSRLNTCLYKGGYTQAIPNDNAKFGHDLIYTWWVKDSLANKDIIDISYNINEIDCSHQACTKDREAEVNDFFKQADNLMQGN